MKQKIAGKLDDPEALETLYRENKREFTREFREATENNVSELVTFWKIRLQYEPGIEKTFTLAGLAEVIIISLLTAVLVKIPVFFTTLESSFFYTRDLPIIIFNGLIIYIFRQNLIQNKWHVIYGVILSGLLLYVNLLPRAESDSLNIVLIHIPLFLWCLLGATWISFDFANTGKRIDFIRFNGELLVMTGLLLIAGGILTAITIGLFSAIGFNIEKIYAEYIVLPGATVSPVLSSYLLKLYPDITKRIVPVLARVFTPIALITLVVYLVFIAFSGARIIEDRNLLILFNIMLVAVLAIIVFSVTELDKSKDRSLNVLILLSLAIVTLIINAVALTAIVTRLTNGLTPNRFVVVVTNALVFINLILIAKDLLKSYSDSEKLHSVEKTVAGFLTVYFFWTVIAIFVLPLVFGI